MDAKFEIPIRMFTESNDYPDQEEKELYKTTDKAINVITEKWFPHKVV